MQTFAARVAMVGLVLATCLARSEARGGHGVQPTIHDGRGVPNRKNFGYYGPKWRPWPGDQPAGPELPPAQPSGPAAPQLPAVDVPPPADEVRKANPIQAGPQETEEPPSDPLPSTVLPTTPAPRDGAEPPLPEQPPQPAPPPRRRPGARNGAGLLPLLENTHGEIDTAPRPTTAEFEPAASQYGTQAPTEQEQAEQLPAVPTSVAATKLEATTRPQELAEVIDLDQVFHEQSDASAPASSEAAAPRPMALGPGEEDASLLIVPLQNDTPDDAVQSRYRAARGTLASGIQPTASVLAAAEEPVDERPADVEESPGANVAPAARQPQTEYARPAQKRTIVRTSPPPRPRTATANPLRSGNFEAAPARLASPGENAGLDQSRADQKSPAISPDNPMRNAVTPATGGNPLRK